MTDDKDSAVTQADRYAMESILWVNTIIDDQEAIVQAFARHRKYGYDQGYYDGCTRSVMQSIIPATKPDPLVEVLKDFGGFMPDADDFRAALEARGLEIRSKANDD
jgi:hypothetical protein